MSRDVACGGLEGERERRGSGCLTMSLVFRRLIDALDWRVVLSPGDC